MTEKKGIKRGSVLARNTKRGRPALWKDPEDLKKLVREYFNEEDRPTLSGLAFYLGVDRKTLYNYEDKDEFFHIIKTARDAVACVYEERLLYENQPTGVIFALKNMGWKDKSEVQQDTTINIKLEYVGSEDTTREQIQETGEGSPLEDEVRDDS